MVVGRARQEQGAKALCAVAVIAHVVLALSYLNALPLFDWPDEPAHFTYVRRLAEGEGLGVTEKDSWSPAELEELKSTHFRDVLDPHSDPRIARLDYEAHQPPLYYAMAAVVYRLSPSPQSVKLLNVLLSSLVVVLTFVIARRLWPEAPIAAGWAALFVGLLPMRCYMAASISNDIAAEALFAAVVAALVSASSPLALGLLLGLGLLVKASLLLAWAPVLGWCALCRFRRADPTRLPVLSGRALLLVLVLSLTIALPWLLFNVAHYGPLDPLALRGGALGADQAALEGLGEERPKLQLRLAGEYGFARFGQLLFLSWWGVFGWMEMFPDRTLSLVYLLLTLPPLAGVLLLVWRPSGKPVTSSRGVTLWLLVTAAVLVLATALYSRFDFQPQGRYLLLASPVWGLLFVSGWRRLGHCLGAGIWLGLVLLLLANLYNLRFVIPFYLG